MIREVEPTTQTTPARTTPSAGRPYLARWPTVGATGLNPRWTMRNCGERAPRQCAANL